MADKGLFHLYTIAQRAVLNTYFVPYLVPDTAPRGDAKMSKTVPSLQELQSSGGGR